MWATLLGRAENALRHGCKKPQADRDPFRPPGWPFEKWALEGMKLETHISPERSSRALPASGPRHGKIHQRELTISFAYQNGILENPCDRSTGAVRRQGLKFLSYKTVDAGLF
jgi:hypothetical protein